MNANFVSPIDHLNLNFDEAISFDGLTLTKSKDTTVSTFFNPLFVQQIGSILFKKIVNNPCMTGFVTIEEIPSTIGPFEILYRLDATKSHIFNCIWLIKDNSINFPDTYLQVGTKIRKFVNYDKITTSEGERRDITLSKEEVLSLNNLFKQVKALFIPTSAKPNFSEEETVHTNGANSISRYKNRLIRAYLFLRVARSTSDVTLKLSFYMSLLETLFTSNNLEIARTLSERSALFVGNDFADKNDLKQLVKEAYNIRSRLLHGDFLNKEDSYIKNISKQIDILIRRIFNKILSNNSEVFLLTGSKGDKRKFETYFQNLKVEEKKETTEDEKSIWFKWAFCFNKLYKKLQKKK